MRIEGSNNIVGSGNQVSYSADGGAYERAKAYAARCAAVAVHADQMAAKWLAGGIGAAGVMVWLQIGGAWAVVPFLAGTFFGAAWSKRADLMRAEERKVRLAHAVY